ncbi:hypothetical protein AALO_G00073890, partial [Alosa alosa]
MNLGFVSCRTAQTSMTPAAGTGGQVGSPGQVWGRVLAQTQRERAEALRDAAASLDARLEDALALCRPRDPGLTPHTALDSGPDLSQMRPTSQTPARASPPTDTVPSQDHRPQTPARASTTTDTVPSQDHRPQTPARASTTTDTVPSQDHRPQTPARASTTTDTAPSQDHRGSTQRSVFSAGLQRDGCTQSNSIMEALGVGDSALAGEWVGHAERPMLGGSDTRPTCSPRPTVSTNTNTNTTTTSSNTTRPILSNTSSSSPSLCSSSDSTSKWSELSEFYSQGALKGHLSLAQSLQFLREEELRARHASALFRLRAEALRERTHAELGLLDQWKSELGLGDPEALTQMNRKRD